MIQQHHAQIGIGVFFLIMSSDDGHEQFIDSGL